MPLITEQQKRDFKTNYGVQGAATRTFSTYLGRIFETALKKQGVCLFKRCNHSVEHNLQCSKFSKFELFRDALAPNFSRGMLANKNMIIANTRLSLSKIVMDSLENTDIEPSDVRKLIPRDKAIIITANPDCMKVAVGFSERGAVTIWSQTCNVEYEFEDSIFFERPLFDYAENFIHHLFTRPSAYPEVQDCLGDRKFFEELCDPDVLGRVRFMQARYEWIDHLNIQHTDDRSWYDLLPEKDQASVSSSPGRIIHYQNEDTVEQEQEKETVQDNQGCEQDADIEHEQGEDVPPEKVHRDDAAGVNAAARWIAATIGAVIKDRAEYDRLNNKRNQSIDFERQQMKNIAEKEDKEKKMVSVGTNTTYEPVEEKSDLHNESVESTAISGQHDQEIALDPEPSKPIKSSDNPQGDQPNNNDDIQAKVRNETATKQPDQDATKDKDKNYQKQLELGATNFFYDDAEKVDGPTNKRPLEENAEPVFKRKLVERHDNETNIKRTLTRMLSVVEEQSEGRENMGEKSKDAVSETTSARDEPEEDTRSVRSTVSTDTGVSSLTDPEGLAPTRPNTPIEGRNIFYLKVKKRERKLSRYSTNYVRKTRKLFVKKVYQHPHCSYILLDDYHPAAVGRNGRNELLFNRLWGKI